MNSTIYNIVHAHIWIYWINTFSENLNLIQQFFTAYYVQISLQR